MPKAELKTRETGASVDEFLGSVTDDQQRSDSLTVLEMFKRISGEEPKMWGPSIVGFGSRTLKYASGRELDWMITGFSPRKGNLTLYINDSSGGADDLMAKLGKYKTGKSCLYIKRLSDVNMSVLEQLIFHAVERGREEGACGS